MNFLIIGASGYIGAALLQELSATHQVQGTYCAKPGSGLLRFDLTADDPRALSVDWSQLDAVILASAVTAIEECAREPQRTARLNVGAVERFCEFAAAQALPVAYLSTDFVYEGAADPSGAARFYRETEGLSPTTQYGAQKLAAERLVQAQVARHLIVRLGKTVTLAGASLPFVSWVDSLQRGERLRLASDWVHGVTWIRDSVRALRLALESRLTGTYNVCGNEFYSRFEWGRMVCTAIAADPALVEPCSLDDLGFHERRPRDLTLDVSKFHSAVPFRFTPTQEILRALQAT